jgi:hypothetical protein
MRLLDRVAQSTHRLGYVDAAGRVQSLASAADYGHAVQACPLRLVLADPLVSVCTALAYADGDRLHGCLDLVRVPAERLWIEWSDAVRVRALSVVGASSSPHGGPAGALVSASPDGRSGRVQTFWAAGTDGEACLAAIETWFDLDAAADWPLTLPAEGSDWLSVTDADRSLAALYSRLRFRLEPSWARYYRTAGLDAAGHAETLRRCLEAVVRDLPMLLALFLLTSARDATRRQFVARDTLNRARRSRGEAELLDHVELHATLGDSSPARGGAVPAGRRSRRLHHVRGHLVRRCDRVYWRVPHLRGSAAAGVVRSRTVTLSFARHQ